MLTVGRSLKQSITSAPELPRVPELGELYKLGVKPRQGEVIMIAGRSGTQKSGFALWWTASMQLPTLYLSGDMSAQQASIRLACMRLHQGTDQVEWLMGHADGQREVEEALAPLNELPFVFRFGEITWSGIDAEIEAWVESHNNYPKVIVVDNLMDTEGCDAEYEAQMDAMQNFNGLARSTGATVIVLHHASDKGWDARTNPWSPPSRDQIKNGLGEKPELVLSVALDPHSYEFKIACLKQRMGRSDPTAQSFARLKAVPEQTRFEQWNVQPRGLQPL